MHSNYGGYAEEVISDPSRTASIEVHGVVSIMDGLRRLYRVVTVDSEFYSVYSRLVDGTATCIGDFPNSEEADEYAEEIGIVYKVSVDNFPHSLAA